jgi:hypothetical protein
LVAAELRIHPHVLFAYTVNHSGLIIRVENQKGDMCWVEADIIVPEKISLSPDNELKKGRVRIGIIDRDQYLEKVVKIYANSYTAPQMYRCKAVLYIFNKDGIVESRIEKSIDIRCELKKEATL